MTKAFDPRAFAINELATRLKISYQAARILVNELVDHDLAEPIKSFCGRKNRFRLTPLRNENRKWREVVSDDDLISTAPNARNPERSGA